MPEEAFFIHAKPFRMILTLVFWLHTDFSLLLQRIILT